MIRRTLNGFTLIELMIVVAIVGILASIAYPSYVAHVQRSHRVDAERALLENAQILERYYTQNNTYVGASLKDEELPRYDLGDTITSNTFELTAQPTANQANEPCGTLKVIHTGIQSSTGGGQGCWPLEAAPGDSGD